MDGITLIREVQARCPHLPAILLTGYSGDGADFSVWGQISGPFRLVQKPVSGPVLAALISAIIAAQAEA
jgi:CheY-like chemotaxis protein